MTGSGTRKELTNMDDHCMDDMEGAQPMYLSRKLKGVACNALGNDSGRFR
jgi:hypothetical protein